MMYSMNAVGQADDSSYAITSDNEGEQREEDPLAGLRAEAKAAQTARDKRALENEETSEMVRRANRGEFDPDHISEEEEEDYFREMDRKRPWWKFW